MLIKKGDAVCNCTPDQLSAMQAAGWELVNGAPPVLAGTQGGGDEEGGDEEGGDEEGGDEEGGDEEGGDEEGGDEEGGDEEEAKPSAPPVRRSRRAR